jgi:hypothetical protein
MMVEKSLFLLADEISLSLAEDMGLVQDVLEGVLVSELSVEKLQSA